MQPAVLTHNMCSQDVNLKVGLIRASRPGSVLIVRGGGVMVSLQAADLPLGGSLKELAPTADDKHREQL